MSRPATGHDGGRGGRGRQEAAGPLFVVKSQIHAGGRGKGKFKELPADAKGGVRLAFSVAEVEEACQGNARQHAGDHPDG